MNQEINTNIPQPETQPPQPQLTQRLAKLNPFKGLKLPPVPAIKKFAVILVIVLLILLILAVVLPVLLRMINTQTRPTPVQSSPTPSPLSNIPSVPSPYADDEEIAALQKSLEEFEAGLEGINFREETLRPPSLDWNITF